MNRTRNSRNARKVLVGGVLVAIAAYGGSVVAQEKHSNIICRAGTVTGLAKTDDMVSYAIDHRGVVLAQGDNKAFDNQTQHCVGSVTIIRGVSSGSGYCRNVDPATGDFVLVEWSGSGKPGIGTFRYVYGTGKWKGISGSGEYQPLAATRPIGAGTYQNCIRATATYTVPKM
jgi:hypothetical protein